MITKTGSEEAKSPVKFQERAMPDGGNLPGEAAANYAILNDFLRDCCLELMTDYGLPATLQADPNPTLPPTVLATAAIDFSGRDLNGTICLRMTRSVVLATYRAALDTIIQPDSAEAADWTCELVNQLIGRLKNKLRLYQVSFNVNSPRLLPSMPATELDSGLRHRFSCDGGRFAGYLDVSIAPGLVLAPSAPEAALPDEGDVVLF
jgi:hypothetical protein